MHPLNPLAPHEPDVRKPSDIAEADISDPDVS
jgi:hypothetical protein